MIGGKPQGNIHGSDCGSVCRGGAEVSSTRRRSPEVNLRLSLRVVAWNVRSQREDDHLSLLSTELKRLERTVARSWWVVIPTIVLVALMVTVPNELL